MNCFTPLSMWGGGASLWAQKSGLLLFFSQHLSLKLYPLPRSTQMWGERRVYKAEKKKSQSSRALPISQRSAQKRPSVGTRKLNFSWASWTGWQPISSSFLGLHGAPHSSVWPSTETKMLDEIGPSFTFFFFTWTDQAEGQGTEDREDQTGICCVKTYRLIWKDWN